MAIADEVAEALETKEACIRVSAYRLRAGAPAGTHECPSPDGGRRRRSQTAGHFIPRPSSGLVRQSTGMRSKWRCRASRLSGKISLAVNCRGTTASDLRAHLLHHFVRGQQRRRPAHHRRAYGNCRAQRFSRKLAIHFELRELGCMVAIDVFWRGLHLVPQPADAARRYREDRRHVRAWPLQVAGEPRYSCARS